ncbi:MAG: pilin [Patescibacteria group bacterium]|jgi:hypothetical protein
MHLARSVFVSLFLVLAGACFFSSAKPAQAQTVSEGYTQIMSQGLVFGNICPADKTVACPCRDDGTCQLSDMLQIFVNLSIGILAISGSVALLMFFYGGFTWVTSMGNAKNVEKGKEIITRAVIGLAIIFGAYAFVNFLIFAISDTKTRGDLPGATIEQTIDKSVTGQEGGAPAGNILNTQ